jgi:hypothetical protein
VIRSDPDENYLTGQDPPKLRIGIGDLRGHPRISGRVQSCTAPVPAAIEAVLSSVGEYMWLIKTLSTIRAATHMVTASKLSAARRYFLRHVFKE